MVMDDGDDKKRFDLSLSLVLVNCNEIREEEEEERNMLMSNTRTSAATKTLLGKRKTDHDATSSSSSSSYFKKRHVVSEEPIRAEPSIETKLNHHDASSSSLSSVESQRPSGMSDDEPIRAQPVRVIKPGRGRNRSVRREPGETPGWVVDLMRRENGADAKLVIEKKITASDLRKNQGRLSMPINQMTEMHFLNEAEVNILNEDQGKARKKGVDVTLVDADGEEWDLNLRIWDMKTSSNFVICNGWHKVVEHHNPEEGQIVRLWSFHSQDGKLYFAISLKLPALTRDSNNLGQSILKDLDLNIPLPQVSDTELDLELRLSFAIPLKLPAPTRDSSILEDLDPNRPLHQVCTEMAPLKAVQETDTRTSQIPVIETSQDSDTELDLELRL